jgi:purine nucleosidase
MGHKIILDTDPGIDDAMALAFLSAHPDVQLLALTTVFGNADIATTTRNALYLTHRFGINAPVYKGANMPLSGPAPRYAAHVHGVDGLGDTGLIAGFSATPQSTPACIRIAELIHAHPHEITLLAIGPLTNLALALRHDPSIAALTREVVVMGGAFGRGRRHGNITPYAEANIYNDPEAASQVLAAPWPVRLIGLDVTLESILTQNEAAALSVAAGKTGRFLWDISRGYETIYREDGFDGCALHDATAAIAIVAPQLFLYETGVVHVQIEGAMRGQTVLAPNLTIPPLQTQTVARSVDSHAVLSLFTQSLSRVPSKI